MSGNSANVLERAVINTNGSVLRIVDHFEKAHGKVTRTQTRHWRKWKKEYIIRILESTGWRIEGRKGAARVLGLNPSTLRTRMSKLGIQKADTAARTWPPLRSKPAVAPALASLPIAPPLLNLLVTSSSTA